MVQVCSFLLNCLGARRDSGLLYRYVLLVGYRAVGHGKYELGEPYRGQFRKIPELVRPMGLSYSFYLRLYTGAVQGLHDFSWRSGNQLSRFSLEKGGLKPSKTFRLYDASIGAARESAAAG